MPRRRTDPPRKPPLPTRVAIVTTANPAEGTPLRYMLDVMRDRTAAPNRRDRMAVMAAPYCHVRASDVSKKTRQAEAAEAAGGPDSGWADDLTGDWRQ